MANPKLEASSTGVIVSNLYTVLYRQLGTGDSISLQSSTPFLVPQLGASIDITHEQVQVVGQVAAMTFSNNTFVDGAGYGSREFVSIDVS